MAGPKHVHVLGAPGVGKSELVAGAAVWLNRAGVRTMVVPEPLATWRDSGLLQKFYENPKKYGLELELTTMRERAKAMHAGEEAAIAVGATAILFDTSLETNAMFAAATHAVGTLSDEEYKTYETECAVTRATLSEPHLVIALDAPPLTCLLRMRKRGRDSETSVSLAYLEQVCAQFARITLSRPGVIVLKADQPRDALAGEAAFYVYRSVLQSDDPSGSPSPTPTPTPLPAQRLMTYMPKIVTVVGILGVGKSTLVRKLLERYLAHGINAKGCFEPVPPDRLGPYYADPAKHAYPFQMHMLHARLRALEALLLENLLPEVIVRDGDSYTDQMYEQMHHEAGNIDAEQHAEYLACVDRVRAIEPPATNLIALKAQPSICKRRVLQRGRTAEKDIPLEFYQQLDIVFKAQQTGRDPTWINARARRNQCAAIAYTAATETEC